MAPNDALKNARKGLGWTQHEAARRLGIDQSEISKYERGIIVPQIERALLLKRVYGLSLDEIYAAYDQRGDGNGQQPTTQAAV